MKAIILAGGSGTRLFPLSRDSYPKQFLKILDSEHSFFQKTILRALKLVDSIEDIIIVTNERYKFLIRDQLEEINIGQPNILFEPISRNTAPAIALAVKFLKDKKNLNNEEPLTVLPSDHFINPEDDFIKAIKDSLPVIEEGFIITYGIKPYKPETGYGYIEIGEKLTKDFYKVKKFHEKPSYNLAKEYILQNNFFWNSGTFSFSIGTIINEFRKHVPQIFKWLMEPSFETAIKSFQELPNISIDYAVMEKTKKAAVRPLSISWSDIGSWDSVYDLMEKDKNGNAIMGNVITINSKNNLFISEKDKLISAIDVENLIIIDTEDVLLLTKRDSSQKVKDLVKILKRNTKYKNLTDIHRKVYRPWGYYHILYEDSKAKVKKIYVKPGQALSLQRHLHRSEHWVVVRGTAKVILENEEGKLDEFFIYENQSIYVPKTKKHRILNPGKIPLEIIEVQVGEYLDEDDIQRFEDKYGRET